MKSLPRIKENITDITAVTQLNDNSCALLRNINFHDFDITGDSLKKKNISFIKCLFSHQEIQNIVFEDCSFEDCQFVGSNIYNCDFHRCSFSNCNFFRASIAETYLDPSSFKFNSEWRIYWPNVNTSWYQALYRNSMDIHQEEFSRKADKRFLFYKRYEHLNGKNKSRTKFWRGFFYDWMLGYGYGILNSLVVTIIMLIGFAMLMLGEAQHNEKVVLNPIEMVYFSIVSFTTVGYGEITPLHESFALSMTIGFLFLSVAWGAIVTAVIVKRLVR